ncbi:putative peptidoglycan-binding domain-containing protein [Vibrio sp. bablab_jr001]|uniref:glycoside hydrolase family 108 protein n=1 Tax=Vibrio sp. bablab_jr001 TaxID=2755067 RepID=UPI0018F20D79|nr:putative peptidoglycan-binding domain-containing protein [Vibrio sp. bablab_jr001]
MCIPKPRTINEIILEAMKKEGFRSNHVDDLGGDTTYGITEATARRLGYKDSMANLTPEIAYSLYLNEYVQRVNFDDIHAVSAIVGEEVIDTGINMGQNTAAVFLQRWLNVFNNKQSYYKDLVIDGQVGPATISALKAFLSKRGQEGEVVLWKSLNCSQGGRYLDITQARENNESFVYGWMRNRVGLV